MTTGGSAMIVDPGEPGRIASRLVKRFRSAHGREPDGVWAAPGRVNLIGEHTDYNRGRCLPIALPHATYVAIGRRSDDRIRMSSDGADTRFDAALDELGPGRTTGWAAYAAGVVWAAREAVIEVPGLDVEITSTVPIGAGLVSSAAIECAVAVGLCELSGLIVDDALRRRLVGICGRAEHEVAGAPTGGMDQTISLFGRPGEALLLDFDDDTVASVPWAPEDDGLELLVVDTGAVHELTDGGYASRRQQCETAATLLGVDSLRRLAPGDVDRLEDPVLRRQARHVVTEIERVGAAVERIEARDWTTLGELFDASHTSLRDDFEVSCPELDIACDAARSAGAVGARMTGGGFGGSAIALVPTPRREQVRTSIARAFTERSWSPPSFLQVTASGGARRVDVR